MVEQYVPFSMDDAGKVEYVYVDREPNNPHASNSHQSERRQGEEEEKKHEDGSIVSDLDTIPSVSSISGIDNSNREGRSQGS